MRWSSVAIVAALFASIPVTASAEPAGPPVVRCDFISTPENPAAKPVHRPAPIAFNRGTVRVSLHTNHGRIDMVLDRTNAPCAVHNLVHLSLHRFYNNTQCWRLTDSPRLGVLQCGDI